MLLPVFFPLKLLQLLFSVLALPNLILNIPKCVLLVSLLLPFKSPLIGDVASLPHAEIRPLLVVFSLVAFVLRHHDHFRVMIGSLCVIAIEFSELLPVSLLFSQLFSRGFFSQLLLALHVFLLLILFLDFVVLFNPNTVLQIVQVIEPFDSLRLLGFP